LLKGVARKHRLRLSAAIKPANRQQLLAAIRYQQAEKKEKEDKDSATQH